MAAPGQRFANRFGNIEIKAIPVPVRAGRIRFYFPGLRRLARMLALPITLDMLVQFPKCQCAARGRPDTN